MKKVTFPPEGVALPAPVSIIHDFPGNCKSPPRFRERALLSMQKHRALRPTDSIPQRRTQCNGSL